MKDLMNDRNDEFQRFLAQHIMRKSAGTTVISFDEVRSIQSSVHFVFTACY